jgi:hypothetical protein
LQDAAAKEPIYFATWSAAVDTVKSHIAAFELLLRQVRL